MIAKGNARGGGQNLATHLLNELDNEKVEVAELRGAIAQDLHGAFKEWLATSKATQCRKYLYSLSISPDQKQRRLTRAEYLDFIARTEKRLGLKDNARAVIFHVKPDKDGVSREHCHVIWSRIDTDRMKAVQLSHDRQKLRSIVQEFTKDHDLSLPNGLKNNRGKDRDRSRHSNYAEKQQEERTGITKEERQRDIAAAWHDSRDGNEFLAKLQDMGYHIAHGDRRDYVVVDQFGEIHSLSRQVPVKSKELRERLAAFPADKMPGVEAVREQVRQWREARLKAMSKPDFEPEQLREDLRRRHERRRTALEQKRQQLLFHQQAEKAALRRQHDRQERALADRREKARPKGLFAFLGKITGVNALVARRQRKQDLQRSERQGAELAQMEARHERETKEFSRHDRALSRVEKREAHSLETAIRRETVRHAILTRQPDRLKDIFNERAPAREMRPEGREITQDLDIRREAAGNVKDPDAEAERSPAAGIRKTFNERAHGRREQKIDREPIREAFNDRARPPARPDIDKEKGKAKGKPPKITDIFREQSRPPEQAEPESPRQKHFREAGENRQPANDRPQEQDRPRRRRGRDRDLDRER